MEEGGKFLNKQNKIIFSIAKKSGSYRELEKIKNIKARIQISAAIIAATFQAVNRIIITTSLVIVTDNNRYRLLDIRR